MDNSLLLELGQKSKLANETINRLRTKLDAIKTSESEAQAIERLKCENEKLKEEVERLKVELGQLDDKNGIKLLPSVLNGSKSKSTTVTPTPTETQKPAAKSQPPKEKAPKQEKPKKEASKKEELPVTADISSLDIRIGKIIKCEKHPEADLLYVEQIDFGEAKPRTVCSGLVKYISLDQMQDRLVVCLCNLKPAKLKGVLSEAMVLCASTPEKVELLTAPEGAKIGDVVTCGSYEHKPVTEINTKNKIFDLVQPDLKTNDQLIATYKGEPLEIKGAGLVKTTSLKNVPIK